MSWRARTSFCPRVPARRADKEQSWFFELATTIRGRFTVEKNDKETMATHPDFARDTRVVHEVSFAIGTAFFIK